MDFESLQSLFKDQKNFFSQNLTQDFHYRKQNLEKLKKAIQKYEKDIIDCLYKDLRRPESEALMGEIYFLLSEIHLAQKNLKSWMKPKKVKTPLFLLGTKSYEIPCPLGVVLIISPWNYPFRLSISPLIGALSAGNCAIIKVSEHSLHSSQLISQIISETFSKEEVAVVKGGVTQSQWLLENPFDHIFFTGSSRVGQLIVKAASRHLTPITLELGGKNPCFVHKDAHLKSAVRRVAWSKFLNNGQTCLSPNFVFVHKNILSSFLEQLKSTLDQWFGAHPEKSFSLSRIINQERWQQLQKHLTNESIYYGGKRDEKTLFMGPTLILNPPWKSPLVQKEIFGPILPILEYEDFQKTLDLVKSQDEPLAAYLFSKDKKIQNQFIKELKCGGCAINDAVLQASNFHLPFGGVKKSGWGRYHGKHSFDTFSHKKSVMKQYLRRDFKFRYPPYDEKKLRALKKMFRIFIR